MRKIQYTPWVAAAGLAASLVVAVPAFAQTSVNVGVGASANATVAGVHVQGGMQDGANGGMRRIMPPGVFGTVTVVNGDIITVTSKGRPEDMNSSTMDSSGDTAAATTYTIDATNAKIYKGAATSTVSVSSIAVGDTVIAQGTVTGTNVVATIIRDDVIMMMRGPAMPWGGKGGMGGFGHNGTSTTSTMPASPIKGNGEPVVGGNITAISGTTLTITNGSNVTYTVDASAATIVKNNTTTALSNISTGDDVIVQGTVNGTSITASSVIDQGAGNRDGTATSGTSGSAKGQPFVGGIIGAIGGFFKHLFGF